MALKLTTSLLLLASIVCLSEGCCPEYWMQVGEQCYRYFGAPQTWDAARDICEQLEASLPSIHNLEESDLIYQIWKGLVRHSTSGDTAYWIGLHDQEQESRWTWMDGTDYDYDLWRDGEPNNAGYEDCVHVRNVGGNDHDRQKWNDIACENTYPFFCRKSLT